MRLLGAVPGTLDPQLQPAPRHPTIRIVGVVEILAGVAVATKPRYGAYIVAAWHAGIIINLLSYSGYYDIAPRDFGLTLAAAGSPGDRVTGLMLGADDYLPKPFHFPELVLRIHALARRKPATQTRILRAAGIELDPVKRTATPDGRQLDLSAKEFGVLEALLKASPGALSAEQLLEQLWNEKADPFTRTVHVIIARLRRKLGEPQPIHTTPGIGYRITARAPS